MSANPAATKLFGFEPAELLGRNVSVLMPSPFREHHNGYISRFLEGADPRIIGVGREVKALTKNGSEISVHLAVAEISAGAEDPSARRNQRFVGFMRDLSHYKAIEAKIQEKLLINERLAAIGQTLSGLAHESRNALQRSHACLEELSLDLAEMPESIKLVRKVQKALDDLHLLLEEVRNYAAPIVLERRQYSIIDLIKESWHNLVDSKNGEIPPVVNIHHGADFPQHLFCDANRIKQVFRNLLENAWQACSEPKEINIAMKVIYGNQFPLQTNVSSDLVLANAHFLTEKEALIEDQTSPNAIGLHLEITDSGRGIPETELEKIFDPFYTTKNKGTGLGLALCRRYVEAHSGRIFALANSSGGGRFVLELPFCVR